MSQLKVIVYGVSQALAAFGELPRRIKNRHMRIAMNAGAGVIRNTAVSIVRRETGLLAKSLKVKVKVPAASFNPKHWGKPAYAVIGPARRVSGMVQMKAGKLRVRSLKQLQKTGFRGNLIRLTKTTVRNKDGTTTTSLSNKRRPSRYAHLVERGHGGPSPAQAYPFLSRAISLSRSAAILKMTAKLRIGIEQEANGLRAMSSQSVHLGDGIVNINT